MPHKYDVWIALKIDGNSAGDVLKLASEWILKLNHFKINAPNKSTAKFFYSVVICLNGRVFYAQTCDLKSHIISQIYDALIEFQWWATSIGHPHHDISNSSFFML